MSRGIYIGNKGKIPWNKGKKGTLKHSEEWKQKMREIRLKRKEEKGFLNSPEAKEKMRLKALGRKHSDTTKEKLKIIMKNRKPKKCVNCGRLIGNSKHICPDKAWNKGMKFSFTPQIYSDDWVDTLKISIRERDEYICKVCGVHQMELKGWNKQLDVHHIDYNKFNCNPNNLISLCRNCHAKTNFNREYWLKYFENYE